MFFCEPEQFVTVFCIIVILIHQSHDLKKDHHLY
uniref:Uncharacterized protein n=1 Tax=Anguilla anguilla TaxID=7936 RepID=A0A0E9WC70_ANGAN